MGKTIEFLLVNYYIQSFYSIVNSFTTWATPMPVALTVVTMVKLMLIEFFHLGFVLRRKFSLWSYQSWIVHRPLLDRLFLLAIVMRSISRTSVRVEVIPIWMHIIPCCKIGLGVRFPSEVVCMSWNSLKWHSHRMLIENCDGYHFLIISIIGKFILSINIKSTAYVVVPSSGPWSLNPSGQLARSAFGPWVPSWN